MTFVKINTIKYINNKRDIKFTFDVANPWIQHDTLVLPHFKNIDTIYLLLARLRGLNIRVKNKDEFLCKCQKILAK